MLRTGSVVLVLACSASAQLSEELHVPFPGIGTSTGVVAADGTLFLGGGQLSGGPSGVDPTLRRLAPDGTPVWSRTWSVPLDGGVAAAAVGLEPSGQHVWVVTTIDHPYGVRMLRWDTAGNFQWASPRFNSNTETTIFCPRVLFDPAGNGYALGRSYHASPLTRFDVLLLSWDPSGALRFATEIDGAANFFDAGTDFATDGAGNFYLTGFVDSTLTAIGHMLVAKVDSGGTVLWTRTFDGTLGAQGRSIGLDAVGNPYACGVTGTGTESLLVKLDPAGNTLWTRIYSVGVGTQVDALAVDAAGGVVVAGSQMPSTPDSQDLLLLAYDAAGGLRWTRTWNPPAAQAYATRFAAIGPAGTIEVAGYGQSIAPSWMALVRFDGDGTQRGSLHLQQTGTCIPAVLSARPNGEVVLVGSEYQPSNGTSTTHYYVAGDSWSLGCAGDGSSAACPCSNANATAHGCPNSTFAGGALLRATGFPSVAADTFRLVAESMTGATCLFFQGSDELPAAIVDDGLGCIGGAVVRLGTKTIAASGATFPTIGDPEISVRGAIPPAGATRHYQVFYRNAAAAFCPPATSNRTNSVTVEWAP